MMFLSRFVCAFVSCHICSALLLPFFVFLSFPFLSWTCVLIYQFMALHYQNSASKVERLINRWAADIVRAPQVPLNQIREAAINDILEGFQPEEELYDFDATPMQIQNLLRHAMSQAISEGIVNCLIVTNSAEANIQLTNIHEQIFSRAYYACNQVKWQHNFLISVIGFAYTGDPTVAAVWRRQTFSAAIETFTAEMSQMIMDEHLPSLTKLLCLSPAFDEQTKLIYSISASQVLEGAYEFSRMLHGSPSSSGSTIDAFYRAFVPELSSTLYPRQIELVKRCLTSERGGADRVGATVFPGLVKVIRGPVTANGQPVKDNVQTVVRRAQVICACALGSTHSNANGST
jgi:hypothetical protein